MHFRSFVLVASAATAASAQGLSEACAAGALIGIFALCGSNPVDCGSGRCCLAGQTCVPADNSFRCADPELVPGSTVTVNAACYGSAAPSASPSVSKSVPGSVSPSISASASASASKSGSVGSPIPPSSSPPKPTSPSVSLSSVGPGPSQGAGGSGATTAPKPPFGSPSGFPHTNGTIGTGGTPSSSAGTAVSSGPALATVNAAPSIYSPMNSNVGFLLSVLGLLAYYF